MRTYYDEEITKDLAVAILGYTPQNEWEHWKLIIGEYEIAVLGYTGSESEAYEVQERNIPNVSSNVDKRDVFLEAGGDLQEYYKARRLGYFSFIDYAFFIVVLVGLIVLIFMYVI